MGVDRVRHHKLSGAENASKSQLSQTGDFPALKFELRILPRARIRIRDTPSGVNRTPAL